MGNEIEIQNLRGVTDYSPAAMRLRNRVTDVLRRNFEAYGYQPLDTAILNHRDLLTYKYGGDAEIVREIYRLSDQGERDLGLRFDLTVPFCKYIALNRNLKMPFKRYEFGKVFRNGPVKTGRSREFVQCDADIVGDGGRAAEAELIELAVRCYRDMGIAPVVQIGNRKLLTALIKLSGVTAHFDEIIGILDKIKKVDKAETLTALEKYMPKPAAETLVKNIGLGLADIEKLLPDCDGAAEVRELFALLSSMGIANACVFTPSLARGLNVYTSMVWEVFDAGGRYASSLGGGGRYDSIITNFVGNGLPYPAVGISFGLEPITALLAGAADADTNAVDMLTVQMGTVKETNLFIGDLRGRGVKVMLWTAGDKVGKAFEYANAVKIKFACVIGENEIKSGTVQIKNMATGEQRPFKMSASAEIAAFLTAK